jgi:glycosyltransferase involved in cell wall biosynthesis
LLILKPRILFLSHAGSRNGATILLLHLLRWLKAQTNYELEVLVNGGGDLLDEFRAIGPTRVWRSPSFLLGSLPRRWRAALKPRLEAQMLKGLLRGRHYDLVHLNTVANWQQVPFLAARSRSLLWHVHELEYAVRLIMGGEGWRQTFPLARRFAAASSAVRDALVNEFGVPADKVDLVHSFIPIVSLSPEDRKLRRQRVRKELGWPEDAFVVGGCGTLGWRKGTDLFLQAARAICQTGGEDIRFLWVGGGDRGEESLQFAHDIRAMGLPDRCKWIATTANVLDYYCAMDVFALTSREDPFPLVMLETAALGLPVVCFENSGGGPEFVGKDAGLLAPYADVRAFAAQLMTLHENGELRRRLGAEAACRVQTTYTVERQAPKLLRSIERSLEPS